MQRHPSAKATRNANCPVIRQARLVVDPRSRSSQALLWCATCEKMTSSCVSGFLIVVEIRRLVPLALVRFGWKADWPVSGGRREKQTCADRPDLAESRLSALGRALRKADADGSAVASATIDLTRTFGAGFRSAFVDVSSFSRCPVLVAHHMAASWFDGEGHGSGGRALASVS